MSVDLKRGETLPIHINMTFPALPCDGQHPCFLLYQSLVAHFSFYLSLIICHNELQNDLLHHFFFPVLSVDAIDMSGKHEVDLDTNIWKVRQHLSYKNFYQLIFASFNWSYVYQIIYWVSLFIKCRNNSNFWRELGLSILVKGFHFAHTPLSEQNTSHIPSIYILDQLMDFPLSFFF